MKELTYPFDSSELMKNKKKLRRLLLNDGRTRFKKKIAFLCGSTADDIIKMTEIFLLDMGIECEFYKSEYNKFWEDGVFDNPHLNKFAPDIILIHTTNRNIRSYVFDMTVDCKQAEDMLSEEYRRFETLWESLREKYNCPIIQNNFDMPLYRVLGNRDIWDHHGFGNFITKLNMRFYEYASSHESFYINDINYISAQYGLEKWADPSYWYMYKYALSPECIPELSLNIANIIKSIFGRNKKVLMTDLDNTLWGGVVGDDGVEGIETGQETAAGECFSEFQEYIRQHKQIGIVLGVNSKNDHENALAGLESPDVAVKPDDFAVIKANWEPKSINLEEAAGELNLLPESFVFLDDNPAEREIVTAQTGASAPCLDNIHEYIRTVDRNGYFEVTALSHDDLERNDMYMADKQRRETSKRFDSYEDYLESLEMRAVIHGFEPADIPRVTQLTNKSNQFNLTTRRYTQGEIEAASADENCITLCGRLEDKFGSYGIVSVMIGRVDGDAMDIELWLMSCRVLRRGMEYAMMDRLLEQASVRGVKEVKGHYYKTPKNSMVKELYRDMVFEKVLEEPNGDSHWRLCLQGRQKLKYFIDIKES